MERSRRGVRSAGLLEDKLCGPQRSGTAARRSRMVASYHHAVSAAREWGGVPEDYLAIHVWFDETKQVLADQRHRAIRHH